MSGANFRSLHRNQRKKRLDLYARLCSAFRQHVQSFAERFLSFILVATLSYFVYDIDMLVRLSCYKKSKGSKQVSR